MNENDFLRGIEGEEQQGSDLVAGAEHLVRLKIQSGQPTQPQYQDLELKKEAGFGKEFGRGFKAPFSNVANYAREAKGWHNAKKKLEQWGEGVKAERVKGFRNTDLGGALGGATALGAVGATGYALGKHKGKEKEAELSESIGTAALCKDCCKEKCACMAPKQKTAAYQEAKAALKHLMRTNPTARAAILGGAVGGVGSAALGAMSAPPGYRMESAVNSGVKGGLVGAGTGALYQHLQSKVASSPDWNKTMLAATTGLGALAGGVGTYLSSRPQADTGKSKMEEDLEGQVLANKSKPERGFLHKLKNRETESAHGISQVFREHPNKAALLGLLTGAAGGYSIGQLGGAIARRRGGK